MVFRMSLLIMWSRLWFFFLFAIFLVQDTSIFKLNAQSGLPDNWKWIIDVLNLMLEKAMTPHSSTLAWKIPWTEEPGRLQSMGTRRVWHDWATSLSLLTFMHWGRKWQPTPVFLPGDSQGRGRAESDTTDVTQQQQSWCWCSAMSKWSSPCSRFWGKVFTFLMVKLQLKSLSISMGSIDILYYTIDSISIITAVG